MWSNGPRKSLVFEVGVGDRLGTLKVLGTKCKLSQESTVYAGGTGSAGSMGLRGRVYGESGGLRGQRVYWVRGSTGLRGQGLHGVMGLRGQGPRVRAPHIFEWFQGPPGAPRPRNSTISGRPKNHVLKTRVYIRPYDRYIYDQSRRFWFLTGVGPVWAALGPAWASLGPVLVCFRSVLGRCWPIWARRFRKRCAQCPWPVWADRRWVPKLVGPMTQRYVTWYLGF